VSVALVVLGTAKKSLCKYYNFTTTIYNILLIHQIESALCLI